VKPKKEKVVKLNEFDQLVERAILFNTTADKLFVGINSISKWVYEHTEKGSKLQIKERVDKSIERLKAQKLLTKKVLRVALTKAGREAAPEKGTVHEYRQYPVKTLKIQNEDFRLIGLPVEKTEAAPAEPKKTSKKSQ